MEESEKYLLIQPGAPGGIPLLLMGFLWQGS
jgi:hypothetical protein